MERTQAQQQIVEALAQRLFSADSIPKISDVLKTASENILTNIDMASVKAFMRNEIDTPRMWTFNAVSLAAGTTAMLPCISWDSSWPLSVYLLSNTDLSMVYSKYLEMFDVLDFSLFNFNLNHELSEEIMPPYNSYLITAENVNYKLDEVFALLPADPIEIYEMLEPGTVEENEQSVFDPMAQIQTSKLARAREDSNSE